MNITTDNLEVFDTPSIVFDERKIVSSAEQIVALANEGGAQVIYPLKPLSQTDELKLLANHVSGFAVSSVYEARLVAEAVDRCGSIHMTTPGLRDDDIDELASLCSHIALNSLPQLARWSPGRARDVSLGLRVNPQMSFVGDARYDPSRTNSKLGAPLSDVENALRAGDPNLSKLEGIHFHSNCESTDFGELLRTVQKLEDHISPLLERVQWINLGGGYLFEEGEYVDSLHFAIKHLHDVYGLEVFIEPGTALVRSAGYVVSSVIDVFQGDSTEIAVLDTTVNHMPEVFEYGYEPDVLGHDDRHDHEYLLAGASCLAGDIFGTYLFDHVLEVGSRIVILNQGAYTLSKAHMFNGINLPSIYAITEEGEVVLKKQFTYDDYASRWRTQSVAPV